MDIKPYTEGNCCGSIEPFLDYLIDAGLDAVNPVQISCQGMNTQLVSILAGGSS